MSVLIEFSMFPTDMGESKSQYVARSLDIIKESGLPHKLGPMGTAIEGEWDEVMAVVKKCFETMKQSSNRVYTSINIDYRADKNGRITSKIESVEKKLSGH